MKIGSMFSGVGGLDRAVEQVFPDARPAWFCEWDDAPSKVLAHHWPDVPNLRDVTAVDWSQVEPVDILAGGFPCQDVSHAGRRQGLIRDGEGKTRSGLWGEMLKAIDTLRPPLVVAENVRGLLSAKADSDVEPCPWCVGDDGASPMRALGAVLADLGDIGFDAAWYGLRAADVGAAHGRFRVFILAWPTADAEGDTGRLWDRDPVLAGWGEDGREQAAGGGYAAPLTLLPTPAVNDMGASYTPDEWDEWTARMKAAHGNGNGHGKSLSIEAQRLLPTPRATDGTKGGPNQRGSSGDLMLPSAVHLLPTPQARDWKDHQVQVAGHRPDDKDSINRAIAHLPPTPDAAMGERGPRSESALEAGNRQINLNDLPRLTWGDYAPAIARWESVIGRPAPSPTEPGAKGNPRLSPRFVEWLMGLPAGHVTDPAIGLTRNQQLKALGNGVVPAQGAAALRHLLDIRNSDLTTSWKVAA